MQGKKRRVNQREELADGLHSAAIHLLRRVRRQDATMAEAPARLSALSVLVFGGSMTAGQLAAAEQVRPPTMSRVVAGLERDRLIKRVPDVTDARRVHLQATPKGAMLMNRGRRRRIKHLAKRLESLTQNDLAILEKSLGLLARILHDWK